ncbi:MAG TPA: molybdopterin-dependent oxidoreductase [Actinoplanes sp.]|nr:molybdopterin-dependent oxidoreductase [Actinoplanes sp.]
MEDVNLSVRAGLSGVAAAAAALGVAEVVAVWTGPLSAPLLAVGGVVVDSVPAPVKDFGVAVFGVHDKTALITGTVILLAGYAWAVGALGLRHRWVAVGGVTLFGLIGAAAAVTRHDASVLTALPSLVGAAVAVPVLRYLLDLARAGAPAPDRELVPAGGAGPVETAIPGGSAGGGDAGGGDAGRGRSGQRAGGGDAGRARSGQRAGGGSAGGGDAGGARSGQHAGGGDAGRARSGQGEGGGSYRRGADSDSYAQEESRRRFLKALGVVAAAAAVSGVVGRLLTGRRAVHAARDAVVLPAVQHPAPAVPADAQAPGAVSYVTTNRDFYRIDTSLYPPQVDPSTWQLRIHGMVRNPITISWEQLLRRPMIERYVTLACVSNEVGGNLIGNARWLGTPIKALLDEADPFPDADQVVQRSVDGWTCGSPAAVLRDGRDALLAIGMNGRPLPVEHGFPVRMVVPGLYGYVSACKWITEIELTRFADFDAYWVPRGWSARAPIKTQSRIDTPGDGTNRRAGPVTVAGVAWAQHTGITKVEVQVDGSRWAEATLAGTVSSDTWRQWHYRWQATPGEHTLRVRATDARGYTQTSTPAPPAPDGATGWHSVRVFVDKT